MKRHANLICYLAFFALMAAMPLFLERYWVDVLNSVGLYLVLALSLNLILGDAGMFNMGHAAFYAVGAYTAAILNTLFAAKMTIISPESFSFWESVVLFMIVILGGSGSIPGVILGAFLVIGLPELFRGFANARLLVFGLALMVMMIVRPQGLLPPRPRRDRKSVV